LSLLINFFSFHSFPHPLKNYRTIVKGKYILIDFWASWCGPCRAEYPFLKKAYQQFKDKGFEIIGISLDEKKSDWLNAIKSNEFSWTELCDLKGRNNEIAVSYGIHAIPQSFLLDQNGRIIAKNLRGDDLIQKISELIQTK
jgi:thiol-disulfide isomerase/thioredoxin